MGKSRLEQYRAYADTCLSTDYTSPDSVDRHNRAADEMRRLTQEPGVAEDLAPLLDEPATAKWLAFHLLEAKIVQEDVRQKCLEIVLALTRRNDVEGLAAKMWLREHRYA